MSGDDERPGASDSPSQSPPDTEGRSERKGEEEVDPADELRAPSRLTQSAGRDMYVGATVYAVNNASNGGEEKGIVSLWPLRDEFAKPPPSFVRPSNFDLVLEGIREEQIAVLVGADCGSVTLAAATLRMAGHDPVIELLASPTARELLTAVAQVCRGHPRAGIVVPSVGEETIRGFGASELRRLHGSLARAAVILTTRVRASADWSEYALRTIEAIAPEPREVVRAYAAADRSLCERAELVVEMLSQDGPVGPGKAVALVQAARVNTCASPDELVGMLSGRSEAIDEWLASRPTAEHVSSLAASIALDGVPTVDVDTQATELQQLLEGDVEPEAEPRRFGPAAHGWPAGVIETARVPLGTYFGMQEAEVVQICSPYRGEQLLAHLWNSLGAKFRAPFLQWLRGLAEHPSPRVRSGAAVTAGILFAKEPITAERELLRPWALDGRRNQCECAGLAIGVPILLGADPVPPRHLAHAWSQPRSGAKRVRASIAAYAGPLGVWDLGSGAPVHLWRIAEDAADRINGDARENEALCRSADNALVALVAAGRNTSQIRETVIGLLSAQAESQQEWDRMHAFCLLPTLLRRITRRDEFARTSLAELLAESGQASFQMLTTLLARALDAPGGFEHGRAAIVALLDALSAGWIDQEVVNELVRGMKAGARPGRRAALGSQLERVLSVERRHDSDRGRAAAALHATFFVNQRRDT